MPAGKAVTEATGACGRLFALWALGCTLAVAAPCAPPAGLPSAQVQRVVDGDTLLLAGGDRVRMVGLDAPELGRRGAPDAPHARAAREHLRVLVELGDGRVLLRGPADARDRYGRLLAVVYTERHGDLAAHLIRNGFALAAPVPPNLAGLQCREAAEAAARAARRGLWRDGGPLVVAETPARTGFAIVRGRAGEWRRGRADRRLTLAGGLVVRVRDDDAARWFEGVDFDAYAGRTLEVRGWAHPWNRDGRAITVQHPAAIEVVDD